ncbi:OmpA family protein [Aggregicoccus sp. 17bor-14]|uniref:OmpA family protein n=1 Tax=Myxococcaceae TaxID=31 RepID=UPI00129CFAA4|nr:MULTISPECIES: OmpA family protein [Myxococcaceae]MBF5042686.1 thrombospondin type 3 repeat-containing protein [Simulacricoccus sp. 17bor-14]MRI88454.1 OmpA family protein [Aggregicoccus sp. 17bor-14]
MTRRLPSALLLLLPLLAGPACVSGSKIRADAEVIQADTERARRAGALRCAPVELATAEANLEFARGELSQGSSHRASQHIRTADQAVKKALAAAKTCAPAPVPASVQPGNAQSSQPQQVVKIQETDSDGDGVPDKDDPCPSQAEDRDGFEDADGCPEPDNDKDGVLDGNDRCPLTAGPASNGGCPEEAPKDRDGDGVPDPADKCPDQAEDKDGFQDEDGCPELDNDQDGIVDSADKCPDVSGPMQNLGCPIVDKDGDGVLDAQDKCPSEPEDKDGFQDEDGCPDLDNDGDGSPDTADKCPLQAGPLENFGCPDQDKDGDGIPDRVDACPELPGVAEEHGCARKYKMVEIKRDRIEIKKQINFASGSARILGKTSFAILDDVAQALKDAPFIKKVRIEGHTDSNGSDAANLRLSQNRADAVMSELLRRGIDPGRMEAVGFGETKPLSSNATARGRAENRRTEFNIVEQ